MKDEQIVRLLVDRIRSRKANTVSMNGIAVGESTGILIIMPVNLPPGQLEAVMSGLANDMDGVMQALGQVRKDDCGGRLSSLGPL